MDFSDPYFVSNQVIVVAADSSIASKDDLQGKKLGAQAGTTGEKMAANEVGEANVTSYDKYSVAIEELKNGQIAVSYTHLILYLKIHQQVHMLLHRLLPLHPYIIYLHHYADVYIWR